MLSITVLLIIITAVVSFTSFNNEKAIDNLIFYPPAVTNHNQWYRFWSCAFIHADIGHLLFNMISLWMFGEIVEDFFQAIFPGMGKTLFIALYLISQFFCLLPTYLAHKNNYYYKSLGASGAVSAVVFVGICLYPTQKIGIFVIPPIIPGFIFAPIYLVASGYLGKHGGDNINHSAHIWGAITGIVFLVVACYAFSDYDPIGSFISQVQAYLS